MRLTSSSNNTGLMLLAAALMILSIERVGAAELIMIEEPGCVYCQKFNREIAQAYPLTSEGKLAPLVRIDLQQPWPERYSNIAPERLTPTFILVEGNREIARMRGYPGDEYFWFLLNEMLQKLDHTPAEKQN